MNQVTNNLFGFALFIACEYASNLAYRIKSLGDVDELKNKPVRDLIAFLTPQGVIEEMEDETNPLILDLIDFYMDPGQPDLLQNDFEDMVEKLREMVNEGRLWSLAATNMAVWSERDVGEDDSGVLVDQDFFLTLIQRAQETKNLLVWKHGPLQAIAGYEGDIPCNWSL